MSIIPPKPPSLRYWTYLENSGLAVTLLALPPPIEEALKIGVNLAGLIRFLGLRFRFFRHRHFSWTMKNQRRAPFLADGTLAVLLNLGSKQRGFILLTARRRVGFFLVKIYQNMISPLVSLASLAAFPAIAFSKGTLPRASAVALSTAARSALSLASADAFSAKYFSLASTNGFSLIYLDYLLQYHQSSSASSDMLSNSLPQKLWLFSVHLVLALENFCDSHPTSISFTRITRVPPDIPLFHDPGAPLAGLNVLQFSCCPNASAAALIGCWYSYSFALRTFACAFAIASFIISVDELASTSTAKKGNGASPGIRSQA
nr:hypothetical protein Iba_chr02aCG6840 [Ipomoea batatas]